MFSRKAPQRKYDKTNTKLGLNLLVFWNCSLLYSVTISRFSVGYTTQEYLIAYKIHVKLFAKESCNINQKVVPNRKAAYFWV